MIQPIQDHEEINPINVKSKIFEQKFKILATNSPDAQVKIFITRAQL